MCYKHLSLVWTSVNKLYRTPLFFFCKIWLLASIPDGALELFLSDPCITSVKLQIILLGQVRLASTSHLHQKPKEQKAYYQEKTQETRHPNSEIVCLYKLNCNPWKNNCPTAVLATSEHIFYPHVHHEARQAKSVDRKPLLTRVSHGLKLCTLQQAQEFSHFFNYSLTTSTLFSFADDTTVAA